VEGDGLLELRPQVAQGDTVDGELEGIARLVEASRGSAPTSGVRI
jgi:hypothetical protein